MKQVYTRTELLKFRHECQNSDVLACIPAMFLLRPGTPTPAWAQARKMEQYDNRFYKDGRGRNVDEFKSKFLPQNQNVSQPGDCNVFSLQLCLADVPPGTHIYKAAPGTVLPENAVPVRMDEFSEWPNWYPDREFDHKVSQFPWNENFEIHHENQEDYDCEIHYNSYHNHGNEYSNGLNCTDTQRESFTYNYKYMPYFDPYIRKSSNPGCTVSTVSSGFPKNGELGSECSTGSSGSNDSVQIQLPEHS